MRSPFLRASDVGSPATALSPVNTRTRAGKLALVFLRNGGLCPDPQGMPSKLNEIPRALLPADRGDPRLVMRHGTGAGRHIADGLPGPRFAPCRAPACRSFGQLIETFSRWRLQMSRSTQIRVDN
jgi:hypothetical protein